MARAKHLSQVLGRIRGVSLVKDMIALNQAWPEVVDPWLAARSWPVALKQGRLTIGTDDSTIAHHLTLAAKTSLEDQEDGAMEELISRRVIERLNEMLGQPLVEEIRFKTAARPGKAPPKTEKIIPASRLRPPQPELSQARRARLEARAKLVENPELREMLLRLVKGL